MSSALLDGVRYMELGWPIIPIASQTKKPPLGLSWTSFRTRLPSFEEINQWSKDFPTAGVGILTGCFSGLVVLDVDGEAGRQSLGELHLRVDQGPICMTPRPGSHIYYKHPGFAVSNRVGLMPGVDLKGDGGVVVAPNSLHANGGRYEWLQSPFGRQLPELPEVLLKLLAKPRALKKHQFKGQDIPEGVRNRSLFEAACGFAKSSFTFEHFKKRVFALNDLRCKPMLGSDEVHLICTQAWAYRFKRRM